MLKKSIKVFLLSLCLFYLQPPALAEEGDICEGDDPPPRCLFDFDEDGKVHTEDGQAERLFSLPIIKTGIVGDFKNPTITPYLAVELFYFSLFDETFSFDTGVATDRVFLDFNWEVISFLQMGPLIWGGYNVVENDYAFGVGFSALKF